MANKKEDLNAEVHVSPIATEKNRSVPQAYKLIAVAMILILMIAAGSIWWHASHKTKSGTRSTPTKTLTPQELDTKVDSYVANKQYAQAIILINEQNSLSSFDKQQRLATVYVSEGDYKKALGIYSSIEKEGKMTYAIANSAASAAVAAKSASLAIHYYNLAIKLAPGNDPTAQGDIRYFQAQIKSLSSQSTHQ